MTYLNIGIVFLSGLPRAPLNVALGIKAWGQATEIRYFPSQLPHDPTFLYEC